MFGERFCFAKLGWLPLAFAGVLLILCEEPTADYAGGSWVWGVMLVLAAAAGWANAAVTAKYLTEMSPQLIALIHVLTGIVILLRFADLGNLPSGGRIWTLPAIVGLPYSGLMHSAAQTLPTHLQGTLTFISREMAKQIQSLNGAPDVLTDYGAT